MLERNTPETESRKILESGKITVDPVKFEVTVAGETVDLPPKEYQILKYMMQHPGAAITRKLLLAVAWGDDMYITERVIDNRVKNLRHKLGKEGAPIKSLIGVGYRFD
jgi:DNA-binding response OmpR family regulator